MHVVIVSEYCRPWPGGISEHVHHEARLLTARGHRVTLLTGPASAMPEIDPMPTDVEVLRLGHARTFLGNGAASRLSFDHRLLAMGRLWRSLKPDVVHVHAPLDPLLPLVSVLSSSAPVIGTFHASFAPSRLWAALYRGPLAQRAFKRLHTRIAVSGEAEQSMAFYQRGNYVRLPNGVDVEHLRPVARSDTSATVLFVGRS